jgi:hypothetical protein
MTTTRTLRNNPDAEQLSLLESSPLPVQFRLDAATRRRGLQHATQLRQLLERRRLERAEQLGHRPAPPGQRPDQAA